MKLSENYTKSSRRLVVDFNLLPMHTMPFDKFDPEQFVELANTAHVDCIWHSAKDCNGYALYDTKTGIRNPRMQKDLLSEMLRHCHSRGIKVFAYYSLGYDRAVVDRHPDWSLRDGNGTPISYRWAGELDFGIPCFNSPYRQYALGQVAEIVGGYDIDLFWIDVLMQQDSGAQAPGCYCEHCQRAYREKFGKSIPTNPNWDEDWRRQMNWRLDVTESFWQEIVATVHRYRPGLPVCRNIDWGLIPGTTQRTRLVEGEQFIDSDALEHQHTAAILRGLAGGRAFHFCINHCLAPTQERVSPYRYRYMTMYHLTHGGNSAYGNYESGFYPDGTLDQEYFKVLGPAFKEKKEKEKYLRGAVSFPYVGVMFSDATRIFYREDRTQEERIVTGVVGAITASQNLQIPCSVVPDQDVESGAVKDYPILLLPNIAAMSGKQAEALRAYVADGGLLIATFETSLHDQEGVKQKDFQMADVFGLKHLGRSDQEPDTVYHHPNCYITPTEHEIFDGLPGESMRLLGPYVKCQPISGETIAFCRAPAELVIRGQRVVWGTMPGEETRYPAIHLNPFGKGRAVYIASRLFRQCGRLDALNLWWSRRLVGNILELLSPEHPLQVKAPETVETTFWKNDDKKQIIVQLLNRTSRENLISIDNITVLAGKGVGTVKQAYLAGPRKKELPLSRSDDVTEILIHKMGLHEIVILQT